MARLVHNSHSVIWFHDRVDLRRLAAVALLAMPLLLIGASPPTAPWRCARFRAFVPSPAAPPPAAQDQGPSLPLPIIGAAIVLVLALAIGGQVWLRRQSKT